MSKVTLRTPDILVYTLNKYNIPVNSLPVSILVNDIITLAVKFIYDPDEGVTNADIENILQKTDIPIQIGMMYDEFYQLLVTLINLFSDELATRDMLHIGVYYISSITDYDMVIEFM